MQETLPKFSEKIWVLAKKETANLKAEIFAEVKKVEDPQAMKSNIYSDFVLKDSNVIRMALIRIK